MNAKTKIAVGPKGGTLRCLDENGEVRWEIGLLPGLHEGAEFLQLVGEGETVEAVAGAVLVKPEPVRLRRVRYGEGATDSGANPDFQPSRMTAEEARIRDILTRVGQASKGLEKRMKAVEEAERRAKNAEPVVEPVTPKPEPADLEPAPAKDAAE